MSTVAERIKEYRENKGLSLSQAAERLEISPDVLEGWEKGDCEPDTPTVFRMAELYGKSADMILFGGEGRDASRTMFPKDAKPQFSAFADWKVLTGALMMFTGVGGVLLMIMRAIGEGYDTVGGMIEYCGKSLLVFAAVFAAGFVFAAVSALVRYRKHKKNNNRRF